MRPILAISIFCSAVLSLAGCGGDDVAPMPDAGRGVDAGSPLDSGVQTDAGAGEDAGAEDAGAEDAGSGPEDASTPPDAGPSASVQWLIEPEPLTIDSDIALDYFYQYELAIDGDPFVYSLSLERCSQMAGEPEDCFTEARSNTPGTSGVRWGIDPSQYAVGENRYRFHLTLVRGDTLVDEDTVELVVNVTACGECGPGTP